MPESTLRFWQARFGGGLMGAAPTNAAAALSYFLGACNIEKLGFKFPLQVDRQPLRPLQVMQAPHNKRQDSHPRARFAGLLQVNPISGVARTWQTSPFSTLVPPNW